jgi:hypothetical protein
MKELKQVMELLELNTHVISQLPSVYKRTQDALSAAKKANDKIIRLHKYLDSFEYANDVLTVQSIEKILA